MFRMIWFDTVKSQAENEFSYICYKLFSLFFCILFHLFCTWSWIIQMLGSQDHFFARSAHQSNKIYNKIQNIWFPLPAYSVLQLPKQCLRKNVVLLNFCLSVYLLIDYFIKQYIHMFSMRKEKASHNLVKIQLLISKKNTDLSKKRGNFCGASAI